MREEDRNRLGNELKAVSSRSYASWLLYMLLLIGAAAVTPKFWPIYLILGGLLSYVFFSVRNQKVIDVYENGVVIYPDSENEKVILKDDLISFSYGNSQNQLLDIEYRDEEGQPQILKIDAANTIQMHSTLNRIYPEKNKVRNEYEVKVEKNRQANRLLWADLKNKVNKIFKK